MTPLAILQMVHIMLEAIRDEDQSLALNNLRTMPIYAKVVPAAYDQALDAIESLFARFSDPDEDES